MFLQFCCSVDFDYVVDIQNNNILTRSVNLTLCVAKVTLFKFFSYKKQREKMKVLAVSKRNALELILFPLIEQW